MPCRSCGRQERLLHHIADVGRLGSHQARNPPPDRPAVRVVQRTPSVGLAFPQSTGDFTLLLLIHRQPIPPRRDHQAPVSNIPCRKIYDPSGAPTLDAAGPQCVPWPNLNACRGRAVSLSYLCAAGRKCVAGFSKRHGGRLQKLALANNSGQSPFFAFRTRQVARGGGRPAGESLPGVPPARLAMRPGRPSAAGRLPHRQGASFARGGKTQPNTSSLSCRWLAKSAIPRSGATGGRVRLLT